MAAIKRLAFGLYGKRAGVIVRDGGRRHLEYDHTYLDQRDATPLSLSLPLNVDPAQTDRAIGAYLAGLLPDHQEVRDRWASRHGVKPGDDLGLVAAIGLDTAGGALFAPEDAIEAVLASKGSIEPVSEGQIADRLRGLRADDAAWHEEDEHWSLAGGQGKFTLVRIDDGWGVGIGAAASTHIVKPGVSRIKDQALAEHVSMRALALAGLPVAETRFQMFDDQAAIVVTRYDRATRGGTVVRIHQEDVLQALALRPQRKYEADEGPGVDRIAQLLRSVAGQTAVDQFVDATIAGYVLGAPDGHAKNYSLRLAGGGVSLAPIYDVSTGLLEARFYRGAAMSIGGEKLFGEVEAKHWSKFAGIVGWTPDRVMGRVHQLATAMPDAFEDALGEVPAKTSGLKALTDITLPALRELGKQTIAGLTGTRRTNGRIIQPFLDTIRGARRDTDDAPISWDSAEPEPGTWSKTGQQKEKTTKKAAVASGG